jgi:hypothetical protein
VTWRCGQAPGEYGLAFRVLPETATTEVRFEAAGTDGRDATVQPGERLQLPLAGLSQRLELVQGTGAGNLRASVDVRFGRTPIVSHRFAYSPPRLTVEVEPRS